MRVQTTILVLGVWVLAGCASGETTTSCGERGPCPRGQVCVIDQCRVPITDGGPLDARLPDAQPVDMQAEDTAVDAVVPSQSSSRPLHASGPGMKPSSTWPSQSSSCRLQASCAD